jgi:hypothetical protein
MLNAVTDLNGDVSMKIALEHRMRGHITLETRLAINYIQFV